MSDRGSILISTANDIGEALVEKLGGEGYAPSVWDKEYNKLGIAEVDSAPALSVLEDSSETGTARGSILLSTANAIGAMLNKKYNTDRGFKPKEWASAASKLAPLPEKSAESSPVCSIEDGADDVPSRSLVVTIPPTLTGISEVVETQTEKTIFYPTDIEQGSISSNGSDINSTTRIRTAERKAVTPSTKYKIKVNSEVQIYEVHEYTDLTGTSTHLTVNASEYTFTTNSTTNYLRILFRYSNNATITPSAITEIQVTDEWKTYTADLGRTVHGGTADIVNGTGSETHKDIDLGSLSWQYDSTNTRFFTVDLTSVIKRGTSGWITDLAVSAPYTVASGTANDKTVSEYATTGYVYIKDTDYTDPTLFKNSLSGKYLTYPLATPVDFTFNGQEIPTKDGYNAFWSDQGNTALDYYGEPEPYTRGTASGGIANVQSARTDLPFTKVKANIAPNLTGVESVEVTKAGKNLLKLTDGTYTIGNTGATATILNGEISVTGTTVNSGGRTARLSDYFVLHAGTYYISPVISSSPYVRSYLNKKSDNTVVGYSSGYAFTVTEDTEVYYGINLENEKTYDVTFSPQLEVGSSATEYTPYEEPTVYTADLGEPVYGGYADLVSGEGVKTFGIVDLGTINYTLRSNVGMQSNGVSSLIKNPPDNYTKTDAIAEGYTADTWQAVVNGGTASGLFGVSGGYICFSTTETDADTFKTSMSGKYLVYPLATPEDFSFSGQVISPSTGVNNLWNNAGGDTDVEYFAQE